MCSFEEGTRVATENTRISVGVFNLFHYKYVSVKPMAGYKKTSHFFPEQVHNDLVTLNINQKMCNFEGCVCSGTMNGDT